MPACLNLGFHREAVRVFWEELDVKTTSFRSHSSVIAPRGGWSRAGPAQTRGEHSTSTYPWFIRGLSVVYPWFIHRKMLLGRSEGIALFGIAPEMDPAAQRGHTGCNTPKTYLIISWELEYKAPLQVSSSKGSRVGGFEIAHAAAPTTRTFVSWKLIPSSPKT